MAVDNIGFPVAEALAGCLCSILEQSDPVACCCVRTGEQIAYDTCDPGMAWVRIVEEFQVGESFPQRATTPDPCGGVGGWGVELELGVLRCAPTVDARGNLPHCDEEHEVARRVANDKAAMREAVICCEWRPPGDPLAEDHEGIVVGPWRPVGPEGGCTGGTMSVTVHATGCVCPNEGV